MHTNKMPENIRKYNVPEASEVAALIVGEQHGKLDTVLSHCSEYDVNAFENIDFINVGQEIMSLLLICS